MGYLLRKLNIKERVPKLALTEDELNRLKSLVGEDLGYGYDRFGMDLRDVIFYTTVFGQLYERYFTVESRGHENLPASGPAVLAVNNAGTVAYDGMMLVLDILKKCATPRLARTIVDRAAGNVPYLNILLQRCGQVIGSRQNFEQLLDRDELVITFPESRGGFLKKWSARHTVEPFNVGFFEIAYRKKIPIVPTAVIVAETGSKTLRRASSTLRYFSLPGFPPFLLPLPLHYSILYGEPLLLHNIIDGYILDQPEILVEVVEELRREMQALIDRGMREVENSAP